MILGAEERIRLAATEGATLECAASSVRLVPRRADEQKVVLRDGSFTFPAIEAPDYVDVQWLDSTGAHTATSYVEVVPRHYFSLEELRSYGDGQDDFSGLDERTLFMARQAATEVFERNARRSFVHRIGRTKDYGRSTFLSLWDVDVYELLTENYSLASDCQAVRDHSFFGPFPVWVEYLYGCDAIPVQVSRAVMQLSAYYLRPDATPDRATGEATEAGFIRYTLAGRDGATGLPEVDAIIEQFGRLGAVVA